MDREDAKARRREDLVWPGKTVEGLASCVVEAALTVHRELGAGFGEGVYENALAAELEHRGVPHERQALVRVRYRGRVVGEGRMDLLIDRQIVVELKSVDALAAVHVSQLLAYLKATGLTLGLLLNFNVARLASGIRRVILSPTKQNHFAP
jgi:GxxExxY protein